MKNNRYILVSGLILSLFAIIGTALVGITYESTVDKIADNERRALLRKLNQILPVDLYNNNLLSSMFTIAADQRLGQDKPSTVYVAKQGDQLSAMIFSVIAPKGYSGEIKMLVGVNINGTLAGVRIVSHKETPGLGDAIEIERNNWVLGFNNKSLENPIESRWKVKRDGGEFDQFSGATITPRAVVQAVHLCLIYFDRHKPDLITQYNEQTRTPDSASISNSNTKQPVNE